MLSLFQMGPQRHKPANYLVGSAPVDGTVDDGLLHDVIYRAQRDSREYMSQHTADKIVPALEHLDAHYTDSGLPVAELAQRCGISQVYFRKIFQNRFGVTPKEYLIKKRLEYAKQLLLSDQFAVSEVAQLCGYHEPCHFLVSFPYTPVFLPESTALLNFRHLP